MTRPAYINTDPELSSDHDLAQLVIALKLDAPHANQMADGTWFACLELPNLAEPRENIEQMLDAI